MPPVSTSDQALQNVQTLQAGMKNPLDIQTAQEQQLGVPQAQQQVSGLRQAITNTTNLLNQIPSSVYGRTAGSLVTSGQAGRQIANEQAPVSATLNKQSADYGSASSDLKDMLSRASERAQLQEAGQKDQLAAATNLYSTLKGREDAQAAQQLEQQKLAEQIREANMANSRASSKASAPTKADVATHIVNQFNTNKGRDGYVSNETWANALNDFTAMGGTPRQFFQNYGQYVNPKYKTSYAGWVNR